jgi:hypothetical protein
VRRERPSQPTISGSAGGKGVGKGAARRLGGRDLTSLVSGLPGVRSWWQGRRSPPGWETSEFAGVGFARRSIAVASRCVETVGVRGGVELRCARRLSSAGSSIGRGC